MLNRQGSPRERFSAINVRHVELKRIFNKLAKVIMFKISSLIMDLVKVSR